MPIEAICPSCQKKLKVPDTLAGKKVRCPKCNSVFMAEQEEQVEMELVEEPPEDDVEVIEGPPPRKKTERAGAAEEIDEEIEEEPRERRRPRRRKRRRGGAAEQLRIPALMLQIVAYGGGAISALWILFEIVMVILHPAAATAGLDGRSGAGPGSQAGAVTGIICLRVVFLLVTAGWSATLLRGASSMYSLTNYSNAVAACVLAMLPCSCGCFMGLPIGIWGLVVLTQENVKRAFS